MKKKTFLKIAIASSNAVTMADIAGLTPAMGEITKAYSHVNPILVNLIVTIPIISMVIFGLVAGKLCSYFSKKDILVWGLVLFTIGGVFPILSENIYYVLSMRLLCGVGAGFVLPTYNSLIAEFFEGAERAQVMGLSASLAAFILIFVALIGGFLATINWHFIYLTFLIGAVLMVLAILGIPKTAPDRKSTDEAIFETERKAKNRLPLMFLAVTAFVIYFIHPVLNIKEAVFFMEENIGDASFAGICGAVLISGIVIFGMIFKKIYVLFKKYTLSFGVLLSSISYFILSSSHGKPTSVLAMFIYGVAASVIIPYIIMLASNIATKAKASQTFIIAIVTSSTFLGQFCSVFYISLIAAITKTESSRKLFFITSFVLAAICITLIIIAFFKKDEKDNVFKSNQGPAIERS